MCCGIHVEVKYGGQWKVVHLLNATWRLHDFEKNAPAMEDGGQIFAYQGGEKISLTNIFPLRNCAMAYYFLIFPNLYCYIFGMCPCPFWNTSLCGNCVNLCQLDACVKMTISECMLLFSQSSNSFIATLLLLLYKEWVLLLKWLFNLPRNVTWPTHFLCVSLKEGSRPMV